MTDKRRISDFFRKRTWWNFWLEVLLSVQMLFLALTGFIMKYSLLPHQGRRRGTGLGPDTLLGMDRHQWGDWHFWAAVSLLVIVFIHLLLHWTWLKCRLRDLFGKRERKDACEN